MPRGRRGHQRWRDEWIAMSRDERAALAEHAPGLAEEYREHVRHYDERVAAKRRARVERRIAEAHEAALAEQAARDRAARLARAVARVRASKAGAA